MCIIPHLSAGKHVACGISIGPSFLKAATQSQFALRNQPIMLFLKYFVLRKRSTHLRYNFCFCKTELIRDEVVSVSSQDRPSDILQESSIKSRAQIPNLGGKRAPQGTSKITPGQLPAEQSQGTGEKIVLYEVYYKNYQGGKIEKMATLVERRRDPLRQKGLKWARTLYGKMVRDAHGIFIERRELEWIQQARL